MGDAEIVNQIIEEIKRIDERLRAIEKEQRLIREDILSGSASERMKKRILENNQDIREIKKKIDTKIKIEI